MAKKEQTDILEEIRLYIALKFRTRSAAAKAWGLSYSSLSAVTSGRQRPTQKMLDDMGWKRVVSYEKVKNEAKI